MRNISITLLFLCLIGAQAQAGRNEKLLASFSGNSPADYLEVGQLNAGSNLTVTMTCAQPFGGGTGYLVLLYGPYVFGSDSVKQSLSVDLNTVVLEYQVENTGMYWLYGMSYNFYNRCTFKIQVDNYVVKIVPMIISIYYIYPVAKISVVNSCRVKINYSGPPLVYFVVYDIQNLAGQMVGQSTTNSLLVNIPYAGDFYILMYQNFQLMYQTNGLMPYTLTVTTFCDNLCVAPNSTPASCTTYCGDGILDQGEQCDNGNKPGCQNCFVSNGYSCFGNIGGSSICGKQALCGDGVLDLGEECDNKNQLGCSSNCKIDAGYKCNSSSGSPSVCGFCGNGIVELGQQCDNKNQVGCSVGCKVDAGFSCRGLIASSCFKNNPVCGNGVWEVAESCDDGNKASGDGCGPNCMIEQGFICSGEPSKCAKKVTACGNGIVEPENNEQCDNGNRLGCFGCRVQAGWDCMSLSGFPSKCSPKVVTPSCGNGVLEPEKGQVCDDGNLANGDGCNYFCKVEAEWICIDGRNCINVNDENGLKLLCGNGKVEGAETCDDGNTLDGDGCSSRCKTESGWDCKSYSPLEKRSYCKKLINGNSYCGDGVIQGNEECDDGFPVVGGDGCSINCRVQSGWTCERTTNTLISRCRRN